MLKLSELKPGDIVIVEEEGVRREGVVEKISHEENLVLVDNGVQEFWYSPADIFGIRVDDAILVELGFEKELEPDGRVKYKKGPFRVMIPGEGNFNQFEIWYREDRRHFNHPLGIHELQNHHMQMTKVPLEKV